MSCHSDLVVFSFVIHSQARPIGPERAGGSAAEEGRALTRDVQYSCRVPRAPHLGSLG